MNKAKADRRTAVERKGIEEANQVLKSICETYACMRSPIKSNVQFSSEFNLINTIRATLHLKQEAEEIEFVRPMANR